MGVGRIDIDVTGDGRFINHQLSEKYWFHVLLPEGKTTKDISDILRNLEVTVTRFHRDQCRVTSYDLKHQIELAYEKICDEKYTIVS